MTWMDKLDARVRATGSLLCVGIDPLPADLASQDGAGLLAFGRRVVAATREVAACYKPNSAFFERFGAEGWDALRQFIAEIPAEIPVLLDAKRGDIASTAEAYADAVAGLGAGAVTLSPYLGRDGVLPFVDDPERAAFVLCRTSNPSADDLQALVVDRAPLYLTVASAVLSWSKHDNVGLVVGATRPDDLAAVRAAAPGAWILAPGVGAQGGDLEATVSAGLRADGSGLLINVSRGISRAADPAAAAAGFAAAIAAARGARPAPSDPLADRIAAGLVRTGCVRFGSFKLKSGLMSPIYLDLRRLVGDPGLLDDVAAALARLLQGVPHDLLAPLPYAALPIGTAVALRTGTPLVYPRREAKEYGTKASVEGIFEAGQVAVMIDDLATTGDSKLEGVEKLSSVGLVVRDVVVLIDRESGAAELMAAQGLGFYALFTLSQLLERWLASGAISPAQADEVRAFVAASRKAS